MCSSESTFSKVPGYRRSCRMRFTRDARGPMPWRAAAGNLSELVSGLGIRAYAPFTPYFKRQ
jgi:hypothetical protein